MSPSDVRRNLLIMKTFSEGMRGLLFFTARCADLCRASEDEDERTRYGHMLELLTPICKAYCSDWGFRVTEIGIQVLGGYGAFYDGKLHIMNFFTDTYLPHAHTIADTILSGNRSPLDIVF